MSWLDLGALVIIFWGAASGYLNGGKYILLAFVSLFTSVFFAFYCYQPFINFAQAQWQFEAIFVDWYMKQAQQVMLGFADKERFLPSLAKPVLRLLIPEKMAVPVSGGQEQLLIFWAVITEHFLILLLFALFFGFSAHLLLRLQEYKCKFISEYSRWYGLLLGILYGLVLAFLICLTIDALAPIFLPANLHAAFRGSYLVRLTLFLLSLFT